MDGIGIQRTGEVRRERDPGAYVPPVITKVLFERSEMSVAGLKAMVK